MCVSWTRKNSVHTSANLERSRDQKMVAKVFVTSELTLFGFGLAFGHGRGVDG
jgi:hypothetical protein